MSFTKLNPQEISQLDPGGTLKNAHDYNGQAFRVRDTVAAVQDYFSHFRTTYDANDRPTQITYLLGTQPHITQVGTTSDSSGSLNNRYFFIYEPVSDQQYYVWYNVSSGGTDPNIANSIGIEVPIQTDDDSTIVALATELAISNDPTASRFFDARRINGVVNITSRRAGLTTNSIDGNTSFLITNTPGEERTVEIVDISYDASGNPTYNGQELRGYRYNVSTGKFELLVQIDNVSIDFTPVTAEDPFIVNINLGLAGTEGSSALPIGTTRFMVRARTSARIQFSYTVGQSGTNFITIPRGNSYSEDGLQLVASKTIYIQAPTVDSVDVEILYWT
jgi:hypothetical protein